MNPDNPELPVFNVGDSVVVGVDASGHTIRNGVIRDAIWHHKDHCWHYFISEGGKKISTRYLASDIQLLAPNNSLKRTDQSLRD